MNTLRVMFGASEKVRPPKLERLPACDAPRINAVFPAKQAHPHRRRAKVYGLVLAVLCGAWLSLGAAAPRIDSPHTFRRLTTSEGMPAAQVNRVFQDNLGFIWFATNDGLVRNEVTQMRIFRPVPDDPHSLGDLAVNDFVEDNQGNLWVATENGLDHWNRATERFTHYRNKAGDPASLSSNLCRALVLDPDGTLWIGTDRGVDHFSPRTGEWRHYTAEPGQPDQISNRNVRCLLRDRKGRLWIGTRSGLNELDPQTGHIRLFMPESKNPRSLSHQWVSALAEDAEGALWVGTDGGVCRLDPERQFFERFGVDSSSPRMLPVRKVDAVLVDATGMVWVGTDGGGVSRWDPVSREFLHHRHSRHHDNTLAGDVVRDLYEDRDGDIWVGHGHMGASHLNRQSPSLQIFRALPSYTNTLSDDHVHALWEDSTGDLWVGTENGGLNHWDAVTGKWKAYLHDPDDNRSLSHNKILSLQRDRRGHLWVGTWNGGLNRFDPSTGIFHHYTPDDTRPSILGDSRVYGLLEDRQGQLWVLPNNAGIDRFVPEDNGFVHYRHNPDDPHSLPSDAVWSMMEDRAGGLWAGTSKGMTRRNPATGHWEAWVDRTGPAKVLSNFPVLDMVELEDGTIWACTKGKGLWRLDPRTGQMDSLQKIDGLPSDELRGILQDDAGNLWVSSNNGLARVDPRTRQIHTIDERSGLPGRFFSRGARFRLRSGELVFGTTQGFVKFPPRSIQQNTTPPAVVLTDLYVFNQRVVPGASKSLLTQTLTETRRLEIPAQNSMLSFRFAVLNYRSPHRNRCLYQLEGFDKEWREAGSDFQAVYTNLDPGHYRLRVKAANNDGVWNETGTSLELIIVPPWWGTWWFRGASGLLLLGGAVAVGGAITGRRTRERMLAMEHESQLARERELATKALQESQHMLRSILDTIPVRVFWKDATLHYLGCNQPFATDAGVASPKEVVGKDDFQLGWFETAALYQADDRQVMVSGQPKIGFEEPQSHPDGKQTWLRTSKVPLRGLDGRVYGVLGTYEDITEFKKAEQERVKLQTQLTQAQKMESVGRLAGGVAHDFNNMLQAILGNAALALEDLSPDSPVRESLEEIEKSARRSADLTRQLLAFARQQTIAPTVLDLNDTVAGMLKMLRRLIGEDITLFWKPGANLWSVKMDRSQLDQVLANLCVNGRDAIAGVGTVTIETSNVTIDDTYLATQPEAVAGEYILLAVSDTGKGMDAATRAHIFEPFFTTKEQGKGTGLGLATVFGIVQQNHGLINVTSESGRGTTFKVYFPRALGQAQPVVAAARRPELRGTETVLLVEDEEQVLTLARRILQQQGYNVLAAASPEAALELAHREAGGIQLLITDVVMPGMNGRELHNRLLVTQPDLPCLFMSGYTADVIAHQGVLDEGLRFIQKPFTMQSLAEGVRAALQS